MTMWYGKFYLLRHLLNPVNIHVIFANAPKFHFSITYLLCSNDHELFSIERGAKWHFYGNCDNMYEMKSCAVKMHVFDYVRSLHDL